MAKRKHIQTVNTEVKNTINGNNSNNVKNKNLEVVNSKIDIKQKNKNSENFKKSENKNSSGKLNKKKEDLKKNLETQNDIEDIDKEEDIDSFDSLSEDEISSAYNSSLDEYEDEETDEKEKINNLKWDTILKNNFNKKEDDDSDDSANEEGNNEDEEDDEKTFANFDNTDSGHESSGKKANTKIIKKNKKKIEGKKIENTIQPTKPTGKVAEIDEYVNDSSDEEDLRNTIGNIPINVYKDYDHVGYDLDGKKISKPKQDDEIDNFLDKMDNADYYKTVHDPSTGKKIVLNNEDLEILTRIKKGKYPDHLFDPYAPFIDFFSHETELHPVTNHPISKKRFIPSLAEKRMINKLVIKIRRSRSLPQKPKTNNYLDFNYDIWEKEDANTSKWYRRLMPTEKAELPGHVESYNPPPEYLFTEEEKEKWLAKEPHERRIKFIPQKYSSLRKVPQYENFLQERYERCLDIYLKPRTRRPKAMFKAEDLIPALPKPSDLRPYPTQESLVYIGHEDKVNSITIDKTGQFMASASDDKTIKIWEIITGRCLKTITLEDEAKCVTWCPNHEKSLLLVNCSKTVYIINTLIGNRNVYEETDKLFESFTENDDEINDNVEWTLLNEKDNEFEYKQGIRIKIKHKFEINQVTWHYKGDYFASVMPTGKNKSVVIHQLSKRQSQVPFKKSKGIVQKVLFHPSKPYFFVGTQRYVRVYDLIKQELTKKLYNNCKYLSSMAIHPKGDNVIIGSYDNRLNWFDLDLSRKPYKTLKYHKDSVRQVTYHSSYPLFASASNDGKVIVSHGMVYDDLCQNALIVPVKTLIHGNSTDPYKRGALDCAFHPLQPWLFTSGADSIIRLFS